MGGLKIVLQNSIFPLLIFGIKWWQFLENDMDHVLYCKLTVCGKSLSLPKLSNPELCTNPWKSLEHHTWWSWWWFNIATYIVRLSSEASIKMDGDTSSTFILELVVTKDTKLCPKSTLKNIFKSWKFCNGFPQNH